MTQKTPVFCVTIVMEDNMAPHFNLLTEEELKAYDAGTSSDVLGCLVSIPHHMGQDVDEDEGDLDKLTHGTIKGAANLASYLAEHNLEITEETGAISY